MDGIVLATKGALINMGFVYSFFPALENKF